ncbi:hypothetical protein DFH09DRAFT_1082250 [Mycena vulgaris]|nr:hypothetical protein DFH09DRAFT_1082250 [Mycena vulgaris]
MERLTKKLQQDGISKVSARLAWPLRAKEDVQEGLKQLRHVFTATGIKANPKRIGETTKIQLRKLLAGPAKVTDVMPSWGLEMHSRGQMERTLIGVSMWVYVAAHRTHSNWGFPDEGVRKGRRDTHAITFGTLRPNISLATPGPMVTSNCNAFQRASTYDYGEEKTRRNLVDMIDK